MDTAVADKIRDIINWVRIRQQEEGENTQKISDKAAEHLVGQLEELAKLVAGSE